ncbi:tyrosine-protein phosphatase [Flaviaesturariibacter terrae]
MFFWKKRKAPRVDLSWLKADMHSHLVPGIDDGAPDPETSLELIRGLLEMGYQKLYTTPHILSDMYPNTPETIGSALGTLRTALKEAGMDVPIEAAAEYFVDGHFADLVKEQKPLLTLPGNLILVEASTFSAPLEFKSVLFDLQLQNYTPVIAHPERYIYLKQDPGYLDDLRYNGCYFQLNLMSLVGHYGVLSKELAENMIRKGFYDFVGTDIHHVQHLPALAKAAASPLLEKLKDSGSLQNDKL